jgi:hypothetical protein
MACHAVALLAVRHSPFAFREERPATLRQAQGRPERSRGTNSELPDTRGEKS